jgi:hypothetical protein
MVAEKSVVNGARGKILLKQTKAKLLIFEKGK